MEAQESKDIVEKSERGAGEVTQFLIRQFKDSTGHIHTNIEKARENETLSIVEAESKEEALEMFEEGNND